MSAPVCPSCGAANEAATAVNEGAPWSPAAGDASICLYCGEFAIFTGQGLSKRKPTDDELSELQADPDVRRARAVLALFNMKHAARWWHE